PRNGGGGAVIKKLAIPFMRDSSPALPKNANQAVAEPFGKTEKDFSLLQRLALAIKTAWPIKPEKYAAHFTGKTERPVWFWLACSTRMSVEDVARLLRTEEGFLILDAIMGDDCKAKWWIATKNTHEIRMTRKQIDEVQKRLNAALASQQSFLDKL